jgi:DNA-binding MarR family transcriptional regulator
MAVQLELGTSAIYDYSRCSKDPVRLENLAKEETRQRKLDRLIDIMEELPRRMHDDVASEWPEHELTMTQFKAMTYLQSGPQRMSDIGRFLNVSLSSVTNLVGRLESKGLVQRTHDTTDRRVVTCELTDEGRTTVTWIWRVGRQRLVRIAARLADDELDQVVNAFEILIEASSRTRCSTNGS